jgi:hypothetical protein
VLLAALATLRAPQPARAALLLTVNSPADVVASAPLNNGVCETAPSNNVCTLRAAIMKANHCICFLNVDITIIIPSGTYALTYPASGSDDETTGNLNVTSSMRIIGAGAASTIIDGNGSVTNDNVIFVSTGVTVTISNVTIRNGLGIEGGGIRNDGNLTLMNSVVNGNGGYHGGGIANAFTGIPPNPGTDGQLVLINSTVSGNNAIDGGGLESFEGSVTLINSTVNGNNARDGGAIFNDGTYALVTLINSTVSGTNASGDGGGMRNYKATANLYSSTVTNNQADSDFNGSGKGGGVFNGPGTVNFRNSIIALNSETELQFGFYHSVYGDCNGTLTSQGNNIAYDTSGCTINGAVILDDPKLGPLQNNGGATQTHALLAGSPAIDAGNPGGCTDYLGAILTTDQRGFGRPANGGIALYCDFGAYELYRFGLFLPLIRR